MTLRLAAGLVVLALTLAASAREPQEILPNVDPSKPTYLVDQAPSHDLFAKGTWALDVSGMYFNSAPFNDAHKQGAIAEIGPGYYFLDRFAVYALVNGDYFHQSEHGYHANAVGAGFNLLFRWHFIQFDKFTLYADAGAGLVEADRDFPAYGTRFNFTERAGLGASYQLDRNLHLTAGARVMHFSNANIDGADRNPGFNALQYYLGLVFTF